MAEYIDQEKTYDNLHRFYREVVSQLGEDCDYAKGIAEGLDAIGCADPVADVAPVVHGRWVHDINNLCACSECMGRETMPIKRTKEYCPNCGAKMAKWMITFRRTERCQEKRVSMPSDDKLMAWIRKNADACCEVRIIKVGASV